jgi:hypothetical protein
MQSRANRGSVRGTTSILLLVCFVVLVTDDDRHVARAGEPAGAGVNADDRTAGIDSLVAMRDAQTAADGERASLWSWIKRHPRIVIGVAAAAVVTAIIIVTRDDEEEQPPDLPGFPPPPEG